jgi:tRNA pseudouridine55 synthase
MTQSDQPTSKYLDGQVLLIDKPLHWSSFDVVNKLRFALKHHIGVKKIKVGHAGTLDPLATGLLIICTGKKTKEIDRYQAMEKEYTGTIILGASTASYDAESEIEKQYPTEHITSEMIQATRQQFIGEIEQVPPIFSAIKVDGQPLYKYAREGVKKEIKSRKITISAFEIDDTAFPKLQFRVVCTKGTYIRSLAHDFGRALQSGAYLGGLRRTRIGKFSVDDALTIDSFLEQLDRE